MPKRTLRPLLRKLLRGNGLILHLASAEQLKRLSTKMCFAGDDIPTGNTEGVALVEQLEKETVS